MPRTSWGLIERNEMIGSPEILHRNKKAQKPSVRKSAIRVVNVKGAWYLCQGPKNIQIRGPFNSREELSNSLRG